MSGEREEPGRDLSWAGPSHVLHLTFFPLTAYRLLAFHRAGAGIQARANRRLFPTTLTELNAIAALARIGLSRMPKAG